MRQAEPVQVYQRRVHIAEHRTYPRQAPKPLVAKAGKQSLGTGDRGGEHLLQMLQVALAHATRQQLGGGPSTTDSGFPCGKVTLGLAAPDGQAGKRETRNQCVSAPTAPAPQSNDLDPVLEVVLEVTAVAMEAARAPAGRTPGRAIRRSPMVPYFVGVIVFLGTVEYKYCVGLGVGHGPMRHKRPCPISRPSSGNPQLQYLGNFDLFLKPEPAS